MSTASCGERAVHVAERRVQLDPSGGAAPNLLVEFRDFANCLVGCARIAARCGSASFALVTSALTASRSSRQLSKSMRERRLEELLRQRPNLLELNDRRPLRRQAAAGAEATAARTAAAQRMS